MTDSPTLASSAVVASPSSTAADLVTQTRKQALLLKRLKAKYDEAVEERDRLQMAETNASEMAAAATARAEAAEKR